MNFFNAIYLKSVESIFILRVTQQCLWVCKSNTKYILGRIYEEGFFEVDTFVEMSFFLLIFIFIWYTINTLFPFKTMPKGHGGNGAALYAKKEILALQYECASMQAVL